MQRHCKVKTDYKPSLSAHRKALNAHYSKWKFPLVVCSVIIAFFWYIANYQMHKKDNLNQPEINSFQNSYSSFNLALPETSISPQQTLVLAPVEVELESIDEPPQPITPKVETEDKLELIAAAETKPKLVSKQTLPKALNLIKKDKPSKPADIAKASKQNTTIAAINNEITEKNVEPKPKPQPELQPKPEPKPEPQTITASFTVKPGGNIANYFNKFDLSPRLLQEILQSDRKAKMLEKIHPGQEIILEKDLKGEFIALKLNIDGIKTLQINKQDEKLTSKITKKDVETKIAFGGAIIKDSLFLAGKQAKLSDNLIMELANIFAYDIDFALDIRPDDNFKILFEENYVEGEKINHGAILAAEFVNNGKHYQAFRYSVKKGQWDYYSKNGNSLKKAFIRTPVEYTRISSHFNLSRRHPILHKIRAHKGVDYAAPTGTPIKSTGDGKIEYIGKKGGYGNTIIIQHGAKYSTLYAHLSRFARNIKQGSKVSQNQVIGYVGSTGLASGPHLHYEFRVNGAHQNPLTVSLPQATGIPSHAKKEFYAKAEEMMGLMEQHEKIMLAANETKSNIATK